MFSVQAKVTLHSDDGLSVVLSRSLLVAASNVMRTVLSDTGLGTRQGVDRGRLLSIFILEVTRSERLLQWRLPRL